MNTRTQERPAASHAAGLAGILPVASYARRSKKQRGDGRGATINIADQHAQNRAYAAAEFPGRPVVEYDDNMSAWNPDVYREDWERMLTDTRAGQLHAVIGRYADRLTRQPEQGEALLSACRKSGAQLHTTSGGHISSALAFRVELAVAAEESDVKSRRMLDHHRRLNDAGAFSGGRRRFGFTEQMRGVVPAEADAIKDACARVLNGESISAIARLWNAAGLRTPGGREWAARDVSALLRRPHLAKMRNGAPATWDAPAIVDPVTHSAVTRRLSRNAEGKGRPPGSGRSYDYSGLILCAECGHQMYGRPTRTKSGAVYACRNPRRMAHLSAPVAGVDAVIRAAVIARLSRVDAAGVFVPEADAEAAGRRQAEREELNGVRRETVRDVRMMPADKADAVEAIDARLAELDAEETAEADAIGARSRVLAGLTGLPADATAAAFDALGVERRRAVVAELGTPVIRNRAAHKEPWNPRRVWIVWDDDGRIS